MDAALAEILMDLNNANEELSNIIENVIMLDNPLRNKLRRKKQMTIIDQIKILQGGMKRTLTRIEEETKKG
jgi:uncharacterized protein YPO0396